jgi:hypothetical protein
MELATQVALTIASFVILILCVLHAALDIHLKMTAHAFNVFQNAVFVMQTTLLSA